jgi:AraC-like DNA-binding protein
VECSWNTAWYPVDEQLSYWADIVCQAFTPLAPSRSREHVARSRIGEGVYGWVTSSRLAVTNAAEIASCTQYLRHGPRQVNDSPSEEVFVNLQIAGSCKGEQDGRQSLVLPGQAALFDTTRPYTLEFEESKAGDPWHVISFRVPRDKLIAIVPPRLMAGGRIINGAHGVGAVATCMMQTIWNSREQIAPATRSSLDDAFANVLASALGAYEPLTDARRADLDEALRAAVVRFAQGRLRDGRVPAEDAARHVGISVRKLHQIFAATEQSFGSVVRDLRLDQVCRQLRMVEGSGNLAQLAHEWGFSDSSHLIRVFRQRHGCTPRDYQASVRAGDMPGSPRGIQR